ncbi:amidase family protein [Streptomyces sp. CA-251387]|uniref:amidase family protein n=1 Tax=Streptomyces sp. CA-251387 TaxID=3240064 RepID=UPI003D8D54F8
MGLSNSRTNQAVIASCPHAWPWNVLGWPAISVPAGFTTTGLPLGAQLLGPAHSEPLLLSLAAQLEDDLRWHEHRPHPRPLHHPDPTPPANYRRNTRQAGNTTMKR